MSYIEQTIKKAIEGGYKKGEYKRSLIKSFVDGNLWYAGGYTFILAETLIDPLFWQALGKAMGWEKKDFYEVCPLNCDECDGAISEFPQKFWVHSWHCFIDHLAEGKDPESFFESLLSNPQGE